MNHFSTAALPPALSSREDDGPSVMQFQEKHLELLTAGQEGESGLQKEAFQCGSCTSGFIMNCEALRMKHYLDLQTEVMLVKKFSSDGAVTDYCFLTKNLQLFGEWRDLIPDG